MRMDTSRMLCCFCMAQEDRGGNSCSRNSPMFCTDRVNPSTSTATTSSFPTMWVTGSRASRAMCCTRTFRKYDYDDMARAQYDLLTQGMGVNHLRLILGTSMGCMHAWVWGETYPDFIDALMP